MSNSFKTQAEIFQALLDGKKIVASGSGEVFRLVDGKLIGDRGLVLEYLYLYPQSWSIYEEPKPKKQVWQWRYQHQAGRSFVVGSLLLTEDEAANEYLCEFKHEKHAGPFEVE